MVVTTALAVLRKEILKRNTPDTAVRMVLTESLPYVSETINILLKVSSNPTTTKDVDGNIVKNEAPVIPKLGRREEEFVL